MHVVDEQSVEQLDLARWRALAGSILNAEALWGPGEATLLFVEIDAMAQLNKIHMGVDGPTDVLSFPIDSDDNLVGFEDRLVGDIVICPAVARANANEHAGPAAAIRHSSRGEPGSRSMRATPPNTKSRTPAISTPWPWAT